MCLILDANRFADILAAPPDSRYVAMLKWVLHGNGRVVFGGTKYGLELERCCRAKRLFAEWYKAGRARRIANEPVDREAVSIQPMVASNDGHIIALARVSGARILCTEDKVLMYDFKKAGLIARPKGRIYRNEKHERLLHHDSSCK